MRIAALSVAAACWLGWTAGAAAQGIDEITPVGANRYVVVAGQDGVDLRTIVEDAGGRVLVETPPDRALVAFDDPAQAYSLASDFRVRSVAGLAVGASDWAVSEYDRDFVTGLRASFNKPGAKTMVRPLVNDFINRDREKPLNVAVQAPVVPPDGMYDLPDPIESSVPVVPAWPMKNTAAVTIILPESDGSIDTNRENWTTSLENQVYNEVQTGLAWWVDKAEAYGVTLSFKLYIYKPSVNNEVKIGYEPISHNSSDEGTWIGAVMKKLGYSGYDYVSSVESFNAYMKEYAQVDNAVTIFVANSENDSDDMFPDGYFAYAHWGGPLIVETTGNGGYGLSMMDTVTTHEMGHSFYAVDEYYEPGYAVCSCTDGYNGCKNRNCDNNCGMDVPCMMKENSDALCQDTVCHIGWACQCSTGECCDGCGYRPGTYACRKAVDSCDYTEYCTGSKTVCPADTFKPNTVKCRAIQGTCDVAEYCSGSSGYCPKDVVLAAGTECRPSEGDCDVAEKCTGSGPACPANTFLDKTHVCRESGGECDKPESCSGTGPTCPGDQFMPSVTVCRESTGECDAAEKCTGKSAECPADAMSTPETVCRESTGPCDAPEYCDGETDVCPVDRLADATTVCRAASGACDAPEYCTGSTEECPVDVVQRAGFECRPAVGGCDAPESCDGVSRDCPADYIRGKGYECRPAAGLCDAPELCTGTTTSCPMDYIQGAGAVCRPAENDCDKAEKCNGKSINCPDDEFQPAGQTCDDDDMLTEGDRCNADGECVGTLKPVGGCSAGAGGSSIPAFLILCLAAAMFGAARATVRRRV